MFISKPRIHTELLTGQRNIAIQRLTALWAFTESGLGGLFHALQIPFTGLVVGGFSVFIIFFIAHLSQNNFKLILRSVLIVLIVKVTVSPYTPLPAYIAVAFQALLSYAVFSLFRVNFLSMLIISIITMLESAVQKLLVLTLFFGQSFWKAADSFVGFIAKQFNTHVSNGSHWLVGIYLLIYFTGGVCVALIASKTIKDFSAGRHLAYRYDHFPLSPGNDIHQNERKKNHKKIWAMIIISVLISVILFVFAASSKQGWIEVLKTISWTFSVVLIWYTVITPLLTKIIRRFLQNKETGYRSEVADVLLILPVFRQLTATAWHQSSAYKGLKRLHIFFIMVLDSSLTWQDLPVIEAPVKETA